jgi:hypothetical protein
MLTVPITIFEAYRLSDNQIIRLRHREGYFTAISAGFFFILVGTLFVTTPNLYSAIVDFINSFETVPVPGLKNVLIPAPASPNTHLTVYTAVGQFSLIWGLFQIFILALRFVGHSTLHKKAETASHAVFWLGANYLIGTYLNEALTLTTWFAFWATIIMLIGVSIIVRAIVLATRM